MISIYRVVSFCCTPNFTQLRRFQLKRILVSKFKRTGEDMLSMFVIVFMLYLYLYLYSMCLCICLPNGVRGSFSAVILVSVAVRGWWAKLYYAIPYERRSSHVEPYIYTICVYTVHVTIYYILYTIYNILYAYTLYVTIRCKRGGEPGREEVGSGKPQNWSIPLIFIIFNISRWIIEWCWRGRSHKEFNHHYRNH